MNFPTRKLLTIFLLSAAALLQGANLGYVYPAGAQAGTTVQVIIGGQGLGRHTRLLISGPGVELVKFQYAPGVNYNPGSGEQAVWARTYMRQVYNGGHRQPLRNDRNFGVWRYHEFMERMDQLDPLMLSLTCRALFGPRTSSLQASPAIAQRAVLTLRIAPDAPPGCREFRLATPSGRSAIQLTNPIRFYVGNVPEFREQYYQLPPRKARPVLFTIPSAINGQIEPGERDQFKFKLNKGETVHFALKGRILNPYIGDGVPGNFQPVLEIRDEAGKSLAFADDNYFDPDPVLNFTAPTDGLYTLEIRDALYRGRADFVYRIDAARGAWKRPPLPRPDFDLPEACDHIAEKEVLTIPLLISGTVSKPGEVRKFRFRAEKDQKVVAEVFARRQGSPLDSLLKILGPDGKEIACSDDFPRPNFGLNMQHVDSYICFKAPASGVYQVLLSDTAGAGGKDYGFFLRLDRPRPDFRVYATPSVIPVSQDRGADQVTVVTERLDGFDKEIFFELKNAPGITLTGVPSIPPGAAESVITLSGTSVRAWENEPVYPELWAVSGNIRHPVQGADSAMQAFAYTHYVPAQRLIIVRNWAHTLGSCFSFPKSFNCRITLKRGGSASCTVNCLLPPSHLKPEVSFTLPDAPKGVTLKAVRKGRTYKLLFTAAADAPVCAVNAAVKATYTYHYRERGGAMKQSRPASLSLPAMRLTVK